MRHAILVLLISLQATASVLADDDAPAWKAGVARVVITPRRAMWMAGYAARDRPSEGVQQELFAKSLAIEDAGGQRLVIVTTDLIGIPRALRDGVLKKVRAEYQLPAASVVLNASHTHCGPELRAGKAALYGLDKERVAQATAYLESLETKLVALIGESLKTLAPARLNYTHGRAGFAMNRRLPTINGVRNSPYPLGPVDHEVPVLRVESEEGQLRAVLFGYACHNTTMGFYKFFGDYAGCAQEYIEARHPKVTALFLNGCSGDQNPYPRRELEFAEHHGRALAGAVETAIRVLQPRPIRGPLKTAAQEVTLQFATPPTREDLQRLQEKGDRYDKRRAALLLEQLEQQGKIDDTYSYPMQVAQFGKDLTLITLSGEVVVDYSLRLKADFGSSQPVWVAGYSHDVFGYVPSRRVLLEGGYEGGGAMRYTTLPGPFAPSVEQRIVEGVRTLVEKVRREP